MAVEFKQYFNLKKQFGKCHHDAGNAFKLFLR